MTRYILSLLLGTCFVVSSVLPASADWEFTKWGMSPQQVVQASNGQARPGPKDIPSVLLIQDWQSGPFLFRVEYLFEKIAGGQHLTMIQLQLKNTELRGQLLADLKKKYGAPHDEIQGPPISGLAWKKSGDNINYLTNGETATINYKPLSQ